MKNFEQKTNEALKALVSALNSDYKKVEVSECVVKRVYGEEVASAVKKVAKLITKNSQLAVDYGSQERAIAWQAKMMGAVVYDDAIDAIREAIQQ